MNDRFEEKSLSIVSNVCTYTALLKCSTVLFSRFMRCWNEQINDDDDDRRLQLPIICARATHSDPTRGTSGPVPIHDQLRFKAQMYFVASQCRHDAGFTFDLTTGRMSRYIL